MGERRRASERAVRCVASRETARIATVCSATAGNIDRGHRSEHDAFAVDPVDWNGRFRGHEWCGDDRRGYRGSEEQLDDRDPHGRRDAVRDRRLRRVACHDHAHGREGECLGCVGDDNTRRQCADRRERRANRDRSFDRITATERRFQRSSNDQRIGIGGASARDCSADIDANASTRTIAIYCRKEAYSGCAQHC